MLLEKYSHQKGHMYIHTSTWEQTLVYVHRPTSTDSYSIRKKNIKLHWWTLWFNCNSSYCWTGVLNSKGIMFKMKNRTLDSIDQQTGIDSDPDTKITLTFFGKRAWSSWSHSGLVSSLKLLSKFYNRTTETWLTMHDKTLGLYTDGWIEPIVVGLKFESGYSKQLCFFALRLTD